MFSMVGHDVVRGSSGGGRVLRHQRMVEILGGKPCWRICLHCWYSIGVWLGDTIKTRI